MWNNYVSNNGVVSYLHTFSKPYKVDRRSPLQVERKTDDGFLPPARTTNRTRVRLQLGCLEGGKSCSCDEQSVRFRLV